MATAACPSPAWSPSRSIPTRTAPPPLFGERQANTFTISTQWQPDVAELSGGAEDGFVIVWESFNQPGDASSYGIFGQRFDLNGNALGNEFQVNTQAVND